MAMAGVRLYRINPSTGGYEPVEGGSPLGCVVMGCGVSYQIFIYNGQVGLLNNKLIISVLLVILINISF